VGAATKKLVEGVAIAGTAVAAVAAAIFEVAKSRPRPPTRPARRRRKIGINAQAYQELAFAAKLANVEQDSLQQGLKELNKNLSEARARQRRARAGVRRARHPARARDRADDPAAGSPLFTGELGKLPKAATTADFALLKLADAFKRKRRTGPTRPRSP
jgi:hypothetical protein